MHFIEVPKLQNGSDEIRKAKDELVKMSNDDEKRIIYDMRANALRDKISELDEAEKKV